MNDYINEVIDRLILSGMDELAAIALVTKMIEQIANDFPEWLEEEKFSKKVFQKNLIS